MQAVGSSSPLRTPSQTWKAYKSLIRYIHANGLSDGDVLPPQPRLRQTLGYSNDTMNVAMRALVQAGALTRKKRAGTVIADLRAARGTPWRVGVLSIRPEDRVVAPFYAELVFRLQQALGEAGCRCVTYHFVGNRMIPAPLSSFSGVEEDLATHNVDGLITIPPLTPGDWQRVEASEVPVVHTHSWLDAPCGVLIDVSAGVEQAVALLARRGCRRITAVLETESLKEGLPNQVALNAFHFAMRRVGAAVTSRSVIVEGRGAKGKDSSRHIGLRIAAAILQLPPHERPDGLVAIDDQLTLGLTQAIERHAEYRPLIASQTNRQIPLDFSLPVLPLEVDVDDLIRQSVDLLLRRIENPAMPTQIRLIKPEWQPSLAETFHPVESQN